jgi:hypothetical protein
VVEAKELRRLASAGRAAIEWNRIVTVAVAGGESL